MTSITQQVEELEQEYAYERGRANDFAEKIDELEAKVSELEDDLDSCRAYIEWVAATYPDAELAYAGKQRLDSAGVG